MLSFQQFIINYPQDKTENNIFINQKTKEKLAFVILNHHSFSQNILFQNFFQEEIKNFYFEKKEKEEDFDQHFENFISNLNYHFKYFLKEKKITLPPSTNILVGIIYPFLSYYRLSFSQTGNLSSLLVYQNKKNWNIAQIKEENEQKNKSSQRLFQNIINGNIPSKSIVIFSDEHLLSVASLEKILSASQSFPLNKIKDNIKKLIINSPNPKNCGGLVVKTFSKEKESKKKILPFSFKPKTPTPTISSLKKEKNPSQKNKSPKKEENNSSEKITVFPYAHRSHSPLFSFFKNNSKTITKKTHSLRLPLKQTAFLFIIIFLFLFGTNIWKLRQEKNQKEKTAYYNHLLEQIKEKEDELESTLIYKSSDKASSILLSLEGLIQKLPQDSKEEKEKLKQIKEKIKKLSFQAKNIKEVTPEETTDYSSLFSDKTSALAYSKNNIYTANQKNDIFQTELSSQKTNKINSSSLDFPSARRILFNDNELLILYSDNHLSVFNLKKGDYSPLAIPVSQEKPFLTDAFLYSHKLYLLDQNNSQILKYSFSLNGLDSPQLWLTEKYDLKKAVSMAIDSAIYILYKNGTIKKFYKGKLATDFNFNNKNLFLDDPFRIWTNSKSSYLYILDKNGQKIAIIDKKGNPLVQFYSDKFYNIRDFAISENEKKVYVLTDNKLYSFDLKIGE